MDSAPAEMNRRLGFVQQLLDRQYTMDIAHMIEMALDSREFSGNVVS
jgi:hypothetical protein